MAKVRRRNQIALKLEPRIALEAIILNRLELIPGARRQEWLRGLVVQGFLIECQTLQGVAVEPSPRIGAGFSHWLAGDLTKQVASLKPKLEPDQAKSTGSYAVHNNKKPFAQLHRVIG